MKESLKSIPIMGEFYFNVGWGMRFFEFIFLARNWAIDKEVLSRNLKRAKADDTPMWLLLFPEGTVLTEDTMSKSRSYCKKLGLSDNPTHVLVPKSTGLYHTIRCLMPKAEYLYDITIGYSDLDGLNSPYDQFSPSTIFFDGKGPKSIHFHINRFKISEIPGIHFGSEYSLDEKANLVFDEWLRKQFLEKDRLMAGFYKHGHFETSKTACNDPKQTFPIDPKVVDWISLAGLLFTSATSLSWLCL